MSAEQLRRDIRARVEALASQQVIPGVSMIAAVLHQIDSIDITDYDSAVPDAVSVSVGKVSARREALEAARVIVAGLDGPPNARGFTEHKMTPATRLHEELRVARYLIGEDE